MELKAPVSGIAVDLFVRISLCLLLIFFFSHPNILRLGRPEPSARMNALPPVVHRLQAFAQAILDMSNAARMAPAKLRVESLASVLAPMLALDLQAPPSLDCVAVPETFSAVSQSSQRLFLMMALMPKP